MVLRDKGQREARVLTVAGEIVVERRYFWRAETGGRMPSDESLGITGSRISPGAMEILCRLAMNEDFVSAAGDDGAVICQIAMPEEAESIPTAVG